MADEITLTAKLQYSSGGVVQKLFSAEDLDRTAAAAGLGGLHYVQELAADVEEPLVGLSDLASPGFFTAINRGTTPITIRAATLETAIITLQPGDPCLFPWDPSITAPVVVSTGGAGRLEFLLLDA